MLEQWVPLDPDAEGQPPRKAGESEKRITFASLYLLYSTGNTVNNIIVTLYSDRGLLDLLWWSYCKVCKC